METTAIAALKEAISNETDLTRQHARLSNAVESARRDHGIFSTEYLEILGYAEEIVDSWG